MVKKKRIKSYQKIKQRKNSNFKKDLFNIRFKKINNQINNHAQYGQIKKVLQGCIQQLKIQNDKKILKGIIKSAKSDKTVVVEVTRKFKHPFYEKIIKRSKKYHAHDEKNKFKEGEEVSIIESKPYSKKKTWQVIDKWFKYKQN